MAMGPKNNREYAMLFLAVVFLAMIGVYWQMVYSPEQAQQAAVNSHIQSLETSNRRAQAELAKGSVNDLRAQALRYQQNLQLMRQLVPTTNEVPALLEQVSTAARRVNLELDGVVPQPVVSGEAFDTYRYDITVTGDYHALAEFLTNVGSLTRIVAPVNLQLSPITGGSTHGFVASRNRPALTSKFEIQTYVAKSGGDDNAPRARLKRPGAKS
jgi:type IV pilus assembly protein PilO